LIVGILVICASISHETITYLPFNTNAQQCNL